MTEFESFYGVNLTDQITPIMVRDAIIACYYAADLEVLDKLFQMSDFHSQDESEQLKRKHVELMIKKFFYDVQGDFDHPTKESLINVINKCRALAYRFRDKQVIEGNHQRMLALINKIE